jgi:hypothetical protein
MMDLEELSDLVGEILARAPRLVAEVAFRQLEGT